MTMASLSGMKSIYIITALLSFLLCGQLHAEDESNYPGGVSASLRNSEADDTVHGELMLELAVSPHVVGRMGLAFLVSDETGIHGGFEGGLRTTVPW